MDKPSSINQSRPPIVVVLGHVDHGKTTLLDAIRKTRVALKEAGGITQAIGASMVETKSGKKITFIDTPGHAAFSKMRGRGAKVADIAVLVVAADDGIKPQTKEAIDHIRQANLSFVVAVTKTDLASANIEATLGQLEKEGILLEKRGGDVPWIAISAKNGQGVDELLETINLMAEVSEIKADPNANLEAVVIETTKDKRGNVVNIVVRNGTLKLGDTVYTAGGQCKIKNLYGMDGTVKAVYPGEPAQIMGFEALPLVGSKIASFEFDKDEDEKVTSKNSFEKGKIPILIKASNMGALEAVLAGIPENFSVIESGVGDVFESDILLAKNNGLGKIFTFETKTSSNVLKLAEAEGVEVFSFNIIYELFQKLEDLVKNDQVEIFGKAEIIATFPFNNRKVAGLKVITGKIGKNDRLVLSRNDKELGRVKVVSMKKQKQEVGEVRQGEEFGMIFEPQLDFTLGDMILSVSK